MYLKNQREHHVLGSQFPKRATIKLVHKTYNTTYCLMLNAKGRVRSGATATNQDFLVIRKSCMPPYSYRSVRRTHGTAA